MLIDIIKQNFGLTFMFAFCNPLWRKFNIVKGCYERIIPNTNITAFEAKPDKWFNSTFYSLR